MKKVALYWQILIALCLAVIYTNIFKTQYVLDDKSFKILNSTLDNSELTILESLKDSVYESRSDFQNRIEQIFSTKDFNKLTLIVNTAYKNKPVIVVSWFGDAFLRALKMIVVLLVVSSLINGVTNLGGSKSMGRIGLKTMVYYISTSLLAILTGLFLVNIIQPGVDANITLPSSDSILEIQEQPIHQTLIEIIPENPIEAAVDGNMLSIIFFSLLFGFFITRVDGKYRDLLTNVFSAVFEVMMKMTLFIIKFAPIGIFGLVAMEISKQENLSALIESLGLFMATVLAGLLFHACISLPFILRFVAKVNPLKHAKTQLTTLFTAFSTASSNATLPITIESVEENSGVSNKISSFTLPLGATINMDGTALYELVVAGFIAQLLGHDLSLAQQIIMVLTALLASIGTAAVPMASLVTMTIIFSAIGLPLAAIAIILPVDRPLDMFRTATNVWSDTCGAVVIAKSEGEILKI